MVDKETASANSLVTKSTLDDYGTFVTSIYLMHLEDLDFLMTKSLSYDAIQSIFNTDFFALYGTPIYTNTVNKFDHKLPRFMVSFDGLDTILSILDLIKNTDKEETLVYVDKIKPEIINKKAKEVLIEAIRQYTFEETGEEKSNLLTTTANVSTDESQSTQNIETSN